MRKGDRKTGGQTLVIPRLQMTEGKLNINMDVSSRLDSRQCTEPSIKFHNKKDKISSRETNILFNIVIPPPQHIIHSPSLWHSSTGQLCGKHWHLFEPYHSSLLFSVRLPSNSETPSNLKLQEELRPGDEQMKLTGK